jgi:hypothetical protein
MSEQWSRYGCGVARVSLLDPATFQCLLCNYGRRARLQADMWRVIVEVCCRGMTGNVGSRLLNGLQWMKAFCALAWRDG